MVSCEEPEENQVVRPSSLSLGAWAWGWPQNTQQSASQTWEPSLRAATSHLFCLHHGPEPMAEADAAGIVPCGAHTPDQGEDEPGLDQLSNATQLFGGYFPEALETEGTASGYGRNSTEWPEEAGRWGTSAGLCCRVLCLQQNGWGIPMIKVSQSNSFFQEAGLGFRALRQPRQRGGGREADT